jgi:calcineurin-like phosphoesterase family protein
MKLSTQNIWFTSDTHYSHSNLVRGVTNWRNKEGEIPFEQVRDFDTVGEMNELIVKNINETVDRKDWLIHLGDWSFGGFERIEEFRSQINCQNIVLLLGNHDHHIQRDRGPLKKLFYLVASYEELRVTKSDSDREKFVLCHYPIISWNGMHHGTTMLHGHQHLKGNSRFGQGKRMDVGLCGSEEFRPYHIEEIREILKGRVNIDHEHSHHTTEHGI